MTRLSEHLRHHWPAFLLGLGLGLAIAPAGAEEHVGDNRSAVHFSGFGTLGGVYGSEDDIQAQRDWGQPNTFEDSNWSWKMDSLIGVQMNAHLAGNLDGAIQLVLKERAVQNLEESLEWAFVGWHPNDDFTLRAGRLGLDFYMLSDYRNVSFAYPWQRPPLEFYSPVFPTSVDGLDATYQTEAGAGTVRARLWGGVTRRNIELLSAIGSDEIKLEPMWGGSLSYESERWRVNAGFGRATFAENLKSVSEPIPPLPFGLLDGLNLGYSSGVWDEAGGYAAELATKDKTASFYSLGAAYDDNTWLVSGEIGYLETDWGPLRDTLSAYLSVGRRIENVMPYVVLSAAWPMEDTKSIVPRSSTTGDTNIDNALDGVYVASQTLYTALGIDQRTVSLGVRWDVHRNVALKFQWDHSEIEAGGFGLWWEDGDPSDASVDLFSASVNWVF